jgi:hypothetical protein
MRASSERGEGRLGSLIALAALVAAGWAAFRVVPVYMDHYDFQDKVKEICRTPKYRAPDDDRIKDMLMKEVRERRLDTFITRQQIRVSTTDTSRQIFCPYERVVEILPGWKHTFKFELAADEPLI